MNIPWKNIGIITLIGMLAASALASPPNIILIMTDDMGYEALSCNGSLDYKTPVLDGLAGEGIRFNNCYSLPICTPSRVKLMTGRYSYRNYERFGLLPPTEITFGKKLQEAGYRTAMVGKWQLGGDWQSPHKFGFDEYCLQNGLAPKEKFDRKTRGPSRYWGYPVIVANGELYESKHTYGPDMLNEFAANFIKKGSSSASLGQASKPFFLYYPMLLTHSPFEPSPDTPGNVGKDGKTSEVRYFKDMVEYVDVLVGNIVRALEESGQRENTLILFTGDNGTTYPVKVTASNPEIRRMVATSGRVGEVYEAGKISPPATVKNTKYIEGPITRTTYSDVPGGKDLMSNNGTHVPLVVSWPKYSNAYKQFGNESSDLIDFSDFFVTFMDLADAELPKDREIDGISFANRLTGKGDGDREYVFCHYWYFGRDPKRANEAIHDGEWKLYSDGSFFSMIDDPEERSPLDLKRANEKARTAHKRLMKAYMDLRGLSLPNEAPNKMYAGADAPKPEGTTLEQQLVHAQERAKKLGKKFDPEQTTRWFRAKDRNNDGILDAQEAKMKAPKDWNKQ